MPQSDLNDLYLMSKGGDREAEKALFEYLSARFRLFVRQRLRDTGDSEDIVQDALASIVSEYRTVQIESSFAAWAYSILRNRLLDHIRSGQRRSKVMTHIDVAQEASLAGGSRDLDLERHVLDCLRKIMRINVRYARILNLHYQGYSSQEICERMRIERNTLYTILFRARKMLAKCLRIRSEADD